MKWFVFSDLHGSAYYCKKVFEAFDREGAERILFLGDTFNGGPGTEPFERFGPPEIIDALNAHRDLIIAVRGNCDGDIDQAVLDFPLNKEPVAVDMGSRKVWLTHGHVFNENNTPPLSRGDILLHGHTHIPTWEVHEDFIYANPGSVALPKGGSPNSYMILAEDGMTWKDMDGNIMTEHRFDETDL